MSAPAVGTAPIRIATPPTDVVPTATPAAAPAPAEADYASVFRASAREPDVSRMQLVRPDPKGTTLVALAPTRGLPSRTAEQLDALEARFAGPYRIPGQAKPVGAPPTFHSNHAANAAPKELRVHLREADRICSQSPALRSALAAARVARPTAEQLVAVTQALIDSGALPDKSPITAQDIRNLQAGYHLGIDCIGFVRQAQIALHGGKGFPEDRKGDACTSQLHASGLFAVRAGGLAAVTFAKAGDVIHLAASPDTENREHNVVVRQNEIVSSADPRRHSIAAKGGEALLRGAPLHLLDIVCSGGDEDEIRGIRHETWMYNASSATWGCLDPVSGRLVLSPNGPHGHARGSLYAAKPRSR